MGGGGEQTNSLVSFRPGSDDWLACTRSFRGLMWPVWTRTRPTSHRLRHVSQNELKMLLSILPLCSKTWAETHLELPTALEPLVLGHQNNGRNLQQSVFRIYGEFKELHEQSKMLMERARLLRRLLDRLSEHSGQDCFTILIGFGKSSAKRRNKEQVG